MPRWVDWSRWDEHLATVSDEDLAKRIGCSSVCVLKRRRAVGCPSYQERVRAERRYKALRDLLLAHDRRRGCFRCIHEEVPGDAHPCRSCRKLSNGDIDYFVPKGDGQ